MSISSPIQQDTIASKNRFVERRKLLSLRDETIRTAQNVQHLLAAGETEKLSALLGQQYPADLADVMYFLDDAQDLAVFRLLDTSEASQVLDEVDDCTRELLVKATPPERLARMVEELPTDEATDVLQSASPEQSQQVLALMDSQLAAAIRKLLAYPKESAGGMMSLGFVAIPESATVEEALEHFSAQSDAEPIITIYVLDAKGALEGEADLHHLLKAERSAAIREHMSPSLVSVPPDWDRERVARIFARYDLVALPVVDPKEKTLLGVITPEDVIDVIEAEVTEDALRIAGSDAEELEKRSPTRIALLRLPWIMATMFIELLAGFVIHTFDATLAKVILLASFMPIISAISGNTGLQSATIIVRGLSTGQVRVLEWQHAVLRQLKTTIILGSATGLTLAVIGALWYGKWTFGLVVAVGMFAAVNIAGVVGTVVPLTSKRLGFDPAITSGPFETAFQDVVGISIFLGLATLLIHYLL